MVNRNTLEIIIDDKHLSPVVAKMRDRGNVFGYISRIAYVFPCNENMERTSDNFKGAKFIRVQIQTPFGSSAWRYAQEEFTQFQKAYNYDHNPLNLINKPVVGIYTRSGGERLVGLVPVNIKRLQ